MNETYESSTKTLLIANVEPETLKSAYRSIDWHQFGYLDYYMYSV